MKTRAEQVLERLSTLREIDDHAWSVETAQYIRENYPALTGIGLAEELDEMAKRDRRTITSQLIRLIKHLLKAKAHGKPTGSWKSTIINARTHLDRRLKDAPSLVAFAKQQAVDHGVYLSAKAEAEAEDESEFPDESPFTTEQVFDPKFFG